MTKFPKNDANNLIYLVVEHVCLMRGLVRTKKSQICLGSCNCRLFAMMLQNFGRISGEGGGTN